MTEKKLNSRRGRYERIRAQLEELFEKTDDPIARMATAAAVLHHKLPHHFWTGFYRVVKDELWVTAYQGPLACAVLRRGAGVCWACVEREQAIVVPDVEAFPGHVACDSRSRSEVVVPVRHASGEIAAVLDVDSTDLDAFDEVDASCLEDIARLIHPQL